MTWRSILALIVIGVLDVALVARSWVTRHRI
jgi:hypothetical protein